MLASTCTSFAEGLNLIDNYPKEGSNTSYPVNLGIKLYFDGDVASRDVRTQNEASFTLTGEDGVVPCKVLFTDTDPNYILVIAEPADATLGLGSNKEYQLQISENLSSADGSTLGEPYVLTFKTRNSAGDQTVSMVLMGVMFVGMLLFTMISARRKLRKDNEKAESQEKVNPYKKAKESGKSVEAIVAEEERKRQKAAAKAEKERMEPSTEAKLSAKTSKSGRRVKHVKRPHPRSEAGSTYVSGRKAAAEKRAKEAEERRRKGTTRPKNAKRKR
jgi:hypothetical protein